MKELAKEIRAAVKTAGIKAHVRCAGRWSAVEVFPTAHDINFTHDEQHAIGNIAKAKGLTFVAGVPIDTTNDVHGPGFSFWAA